MNSRVSSRTFETASVRAPTSIEIVANGNNNSLYQSYSYAISQTGSVSVSVTDVTPSVSVTGDTAATVTGDTYSLVPTFSDPGSGDTPRRWTVAWGDGTSANSSSPPGPGFFSTNGSSSEASSTRVDMMVNPVLASLVINEINPIPGSLAFYLFEPDGLSFPALLDELIELAAVDQVASP